MEPENPLTPHPPDLETESASHPAEAATADAALADFPQLAAAAFTPQPAGPPEPGTLPWFFLGANNVLRSGWSIAIFIPVMLLIIGIVGTILHLLHLIGNHVGQENAGAACITEFMMISGLLGAAAIVALIEQRPRNLLEYKLLGPTRLRHFAVGVVAGFAALSLLVGALKAGGWLTMAPTATSLPELLRTGLLWALMFLMVGIYEEGTFRCYLQTTLERGLNIWWAIGIEALICGALLGFGKGNGIWGVLLIALLGLGPCLWLALRKAESTRFWLAAWVASTVFGLVHTGNNGENWIGIFAAAAIGFVFAVSIRLTGSAWWAIGFHAAWDWAETYFYGTADSGMQAHGSLQLSKPQGNPFWSGGTDGPEGSVLVLAVILLTLLALVIGYGRNARPAQSTIDSEA